MINFGEQTWEGAMRHAHAALVASGRLYEETSAPGRRSSIDIEKHPRRSEMEAAHAQASVALARALATEGNRT